MRDKKIQNTTLPVQLDAGGKSTSGNVVVRTWGEVERDRRALRPLVVSWVLALGSIPLSFVNFFLVPAFFALGIALFFRTRKQAGIFLSVDAPCPFCANQLTLGSAREKLAWPLRLVCARCHEPVLGKPLPRSALKKRRAG